MKQSEDFQKTFADLGLVDESNQNNMFNKVQEFICRLHGLKKTKSIDEARFDLFSKTYKCFSTANDSLKIKIKNVDGSSMLPCQSELMQQFLRASLITNIWRNAHRQIPTELSPIDYGWKLVDEKYEFDWFKGDQLPQLVQDVIIQPLQENTDCQFETSELGVSDHDSEINDMEDSDDELYDDNL
ncbi:hypothetical protein TSAR_007910 [Trichomalopsis sarcophagae]|uniref:Uncharacterized protein n=1 Tax=Trichomalopsis sarcophagae TaxID=543379 RepID=A0A232FMC6_9HYME|nr:hypothetical protein TSAR_007910 [Trichomalopsis sarcophagae]